MTCDGDIMILALSDLPWCWSHIHLKQKCEQMPGLWRFPIILNVILELVALLLPTSESLSKILPRPLRSRMLRSSKLVLNACQKNVKRNEISRGALTENDGIKNVEINEIMPVNIIPRARDWIEAGRETTEMRNQEDSSNLDNFLKHEHEHASQRWPDDFLPINGFSSETGLKFALFWWIW